MTNDAVGVSTFLLAGHLPWFTGHTIRASSIGSCYFMGGLGNAAKAAKLTVLRKAPSQWERSSTVDRFIPDSSSVVGLRIERRGRFALLGRYLTISTMPHGNYY